MSSMLQAYCSFNPAFLATILLKIITCMKFSFSNYLGGYSYSFQGSFELNSITAAVSLFFSSRMQLQEILPSGISDNFLQLQLHDLMVFKLEM